MILWAFNCEGKHCPIDHGVLCLQPKCCRKDDTVVIPSSITAHERNLRQLPCALTGQTRELSLHHARAGSMKETPLGTPGAGQKANPALQIRLSMEYHVGRHGIDARLNSSTSRWEETYSTQVELLNTTSQKLGYSVWMLAYQWASHYQQRRVERFCAQFPSLFLRPSTPTTTPGS